MASRASPDLPGGGSAHRRAQRATHLCGGSGIFQAGFCIDGLFELHISKLFGVKDFATFHALNKLGVFVPGNYAYPGMFADGCHLSFYRLNEQLFPQDCIGLLLNLKLESVDCFLPVPIFCQIAASISNCA
jgi:hypothetical protein